MVRNFLYVFLLCERRNEEDLGVMKDLDNDSFQSNLNKAIFQCTYSSEIKYEYNYVFFCICFRH